MPDDTLAIKERVAGYRARAEEALRVASGTIDPRARVQFLQIAEDWRNLADVIERTLWERSG
jgi:hypothetical protein